MITKNGAQRQRNRPFAEFHKTLLYVTPICQDKNLYLQNWCFGLSLEKERRTPIKKIDRLDHVLSKKAFCVLSASDQWGLYTVRVKSALQNIRCDLVALDNIFQNN